MTARTDHAGHKVRCLVRRRVGQFRNRRRAATDGVAAEIIIIVLAGMSRIVQLADEAGVRDLRVARLHAAPELVRGGEASAVGFSARVHRVAGVVVDRLVLPTQRLPVPAVTRARRGLSVGELEEQMLPLAVPYNNIIIMRISLAHISSHKLP